MLYKCYLGQHISVASLALCLSFPFSHNLINPHPCLYLILHLCPFHLVHVTVESVLSKSRPPNAIE